MPSNADVAERRDEAAPAAEAGVVRRLFAAAEERDRQAVQDAYTTNVVGHQERNTPA